MEVARGRGWLLQGGGVHRWFFEVLQGSASLARGTIVLSGTPELEPDIREPVFAAVFRRIVVVTRLSSLSSQDLINIFCSFVAGFTPGEPEESLQRHAKRLTCEDGPWRSSRISIDMAKQFLMQRISSFRAAEVSQELGMPDAPFRVPPESRARFFDHVCDAAAGRQYLQVYPSVRECAGEVFQRD